MERKLRTIMSTSAEIELLRETNHNLVLEVDELKNLLKQREQYIDIMAKEKFIVDQKLFRLEKICLEVYNKTKSCFGKIVECSEDFTDIFGFLKTVNNFKESLHTLEAQTANLSHLINQSSSHEVQKCKDQNSFKNVQESLSLHESSFISRGGKTVLSDNNNEDIADSDLELESDVAGGTICESNQIIAGRELSTIYEDVEISARDPDESERQKDFILPNASSVLTLQYPISMTLDDEIHFHSKDVNVEENGDPSDPKDNISTYVEPSSVLENSMVNDSELQSENITYTPKRSSKRKSIASPPPSYNGRTKIILRKSIVKRRHSFGGKQRQSSGGKKTQLEMTNSPAAYTVTKNRKSKEKQRQSPGAKLILSPGEKERPQLEMTKSFQSSTLTDDITLPASLLEKNFKADHDLSYRPDLIKNTSTPIQPPPRTGNTKRITRTICDEKSETTSEIHGNTSLVEENRISSLANNEPDPDDISLLHSERRRCSTINHLQLYKGQSKMKPRGAAKSSKFVCDAEPVPSVNKQTIETSQKVNPSIPKKLTSGGRGMEGGSAEQAVSKRTRFVVDTDQENESDSSEYEMVQNNTSTQGNSTDHNVSASRYPKRERKQTLDLLQQYIESCQRSRRAAKAVVYKEPNCRRKLRRS